MVGHKISIPRGQPAPRAGEEGRHPEAPEVDTHPSGAAFLCPSACLILGGHGVRQDIYCANFAWKWISASKEGIGRGP